MAALGLEPGTPRSQVRTPTNYANDATIQCALQWLIYPYSMFQLPQRMGAIVLKRSFAACSQVLLFTRVEWGNVCKVLCPRAQRQLLETGLIDQRCQLIRVTAQRSLTRWAIQREHHSTTHASPMVLYNILFYLQSVLISTILGF